jgi:hypothetical protein
LTIPHPSHAKPLRLTRCLALLAVDAEHKGVDGFVLSGLSLAVMHDLASTASHASPQPQVALQCLLSSPSSRPHRSCRRYDTRSRHCQTRS